MLCLYAFVAVSHMALKADFIGAYGVCQACLEDWRIRILCMLASRPMTAFAGDSGLDPLSCGHEAGKVASITGR